MSRDERMSSHNKLALLKARQASDFDVATLIEWSRDKNNNVREWATFCLGSQLNVDGEDVRQALKYRLDDADFDTRCEAMVGLARRRDEAGIRPLMDWLAGDARVGRLVEGGRLKGLSFGYRVRDAREGGAARELIDLDLVEVSLVARPMQRSAKVHAIEV